MRNISDVPYVDVVAALATAEEVRALDTSRVSDVTDGETLGLGALVIGARFFALVTGLSIELVPGPGSGEGLLRDLCVRVPCERNLPRRRIKLPE